MGGESKYDFDYDPDNRIFYKRQSGNLTKEDIFVSWEYAIEENLIPDDVNGFLIDLSKAHIDIDLAKAKSIPEYFDAYPKIFAGKKIAIIIRSPDEIVLPILVEHMQKSFFLKPFATEAAAVNWILG